MINKKYETLDAVRLTKLFIAGSRWLSKYADILNDLNVYPVPDGDTGTNMSMTLQAVENELIKLSKEVEMNELCEIVAEAVLLGARGNSGTILSQIIQGSLNVIENHKEINVDIAKQALRSAKEKAYKAVSEPVEGTILTVIRKISEAADAYNGKDLFELLKIMKKTANDAVEDTPNLLSKLKEAGVVDAGGKGLFYIIEGFEKSVTDTEMLKDLSRIVESQSHRQQKMEHIAKEDIKFSYCTEFIIESGDFDLEEYKSKIKDLGDSMVCAQTSKKTKTHIHTNNPGRVLEIAVAHGPLNNIKIENMKTQHKHLLVSEAELHGEVLKDTSEFLYEPKNRSQYSIYAIADNEQLAKLFIKDGATAVLIGGQTNNPSVSDIEKGLKKIDAETIYILPNNKNIIASAKMVADRDSRNIIVIDTKTMLEGHFFIRSKKFKVENTLKQRLLNKSIEITKAVRNTKADNLEILEGDYIALVNGKIKYKNTEISDLLKEIFKDFVNNDTLRITVAKGRDANKDLDVMFKDLKVRELKIFDTKQDNYPYYIYIEQRDPKQPKIAIVTDSSSDLIPEIIGDLHISVVSLKVQIGETTYKDGINISRQEFWKRILVDKVIPKTAQPSPAEFKNTYTELFKRGYDKIISIHLSSRISGTYQAAKIAREMTSENQDKIEIIDSKSITFGLAHQVLEAAKMAKAGAEFNEIVDYVNSLTDMKILFAVDDLTYLQKGGRIGRASAAIGGIFKLKPVITIEDGVLSLATKTFGDGGPISFMQKIIKEEGKRNSCIMYTAWGGTNKELRNADLLRKYAEQFRKIEVRQRFEIGPTIGTHSGPVYGMMIISKIR